MEVSELTGDAREDYEIEALRHTRRKLEWARQDLRSGHGRQVHEVGLRGAYPDTSIVVRFDQSGRRQEREYPIWIEGSAVVWKGRVHADPETLGTIIYSDMTD
jgi:hypothetical protein